MTSLICLSNLTLSKKFIHPVRHRYRWRSNFAPMQTSTPASKFVLWLQIWFTSRQNRKPTISRIYALVGLEVSQLKRPSNPTVYLTADRQASHSEYPLLTKWLEWSLARASPRDPVKAFSPNNLSTSSNRIENCTTKRTLYSLCKIRSFAPAPHHRAVPFWITPSVMK